MHLAVCYANLRPQTLNCSLVLCMFGSLISYSQKYLECRMRLIVLLRCQRNLTYFKLSLAPPGCQDVLGRRDFGHEGEALSLNHHLGEAASHLQNRICFANPHYFHQFFVPFSSGSLFMISILAGANNTTSRCIYHLPLKLYLNNMG